MSVSQGSGGRGQVQGTASLSVWGSVQTSFMEGWRDFSRGVMVVDQKFPKSRERCGKCYINQPEKSVICLLRTEERFSATGWSPSHPDTRPLEKDSIAHLSKIHNKSMPASKSGLLKKRSSSSPSHLLQAPENVTVKLWREKHKLRERKKTYWSHLTFLKAGFSEGKSNLGMGKESLEFKMVWEFVLLLSLEMTACDCSMMTHGCRPFYYRQLTRGLMETTWVFIQV